MWTLVGLVKGEAVTMPLTVASAWLSPVTGRLVTTEASGVISLFQPPKVVKDVHGHRISLRLVARHDLTELTPAPKRPPAKATEPLSDDEMR